MRTHVLLLSALAALGCVRAAEGRSVSPAFLPEAKQARGDIVWVREILHEDRRFQGWPTVLRRRSGELIVTFSGDRDGHICPYGKVRLIRSADDGETWSAPETVYSDMIDDRDAGIVELDNGDLVVFFFNSLAYVQMPEYRRLWEKQDQVRAKELLGAYSIRSTDGGRTWESPVRMASSAPHGGIQLRDGRLMVVGKAFDAVDLMTEVSADRGRSWKVHSRFTAFRDAKPENLYEPHLIENADGSLVAQFRMGDTAVMQSESRDGGLTWTPIHATGLRGMPPHLCRLPDGRLVSSYANRQKGTWGEYVAFSDDDGRTWDAERALYLARGERGDLGYPSSAVLPDGSVLTVYYQNARQGEYPTCGLMATKWRPRARGDGR